MKFLDMFTEDCKYYDPKNIEVKTILKYVKLKGKTILDIGAGIGRLSFPLAKYAKKVIALDKDKRVMEYFRKHKKKNVEFANQDAKHYLKKGMKFDVILLAWPTIHFKFIEICKKAMHENSILIFITCDNNSDFETIVDKLRVVKRNYFDKAIADKMKFLKLLPIKLKLLIKKKIPTEYLYPSKKTAFRVLKNDMEMWFNIKLDKPAERRLLDLIKKHKKGENIRFKEIIWFYILKLK